MAIISSGNSGNDQEVSLLPATLDFRLYRGDSIDLNFVLKDSVGTPVNLDGFIGTVQFRDSSDNIVATPVVTVNNGGLMGAVRIFLADTTLLPIGDYDYDFQLEDLEGTKRTYIAGTVTLQKDITR